MFLHTQGLHGFIVGVATSLDGLRFVRALPIPGTTLSTLRPATAPCMVPPWCFHEPGYWWAFVGHHKAEDRGYRMRFTGWVVDPAEKENVSFELWNPQRMHLKFDPKSWDRGNVHVARFLEVGNECWVYYVSQDGIGLARVGRHRMYGVQLNPGEQTGQVISIGLHPPEEEWRQHWLVVNVSVISKGDVLLLSWFPQQMNNQSRVSHWRSRSRLRRTVTIYRWSGSTTERSCRTREIRFELTRGMKTSRLHTIYIRKQHT